MISNVFPGRPPSAERLGRSYLAIADALQADIQAGRLATGTRAPPQRSALAEALGIDFTTVTRAYAEARKRGLVAEKPGRAGHSYVGQGRATAPPHTSGSIERSAGST